MSSMIVAPSTSSKGKAPIRPYSLTASASPQGQRAPRLPAYEEVSTPVFPLEVFENVIDACATPYYSDDSPTRIATLQAFALTCRVLLPRSRMHLFSDIRIVSTSSLHRLVDLLVRSPEHGDFIRRLSFDGSVHWRDCTIGLTFTMLARRVKRLWNLEIAYGLTHPHASFYAMVASYTSVTHLRFYGRSFTENQDLLKTIAWFPNLTHLAYQSFPLDDKTRENRLPNVNQKRLKKCQLVCLVVDLPSDYPLAERDIVLSWLPKSGTPGSLQKLWLEVKPLLPGRTDHVMVNDFLEACGGSIQHLVIKWFTDLLQQGDAQRHDLGRVGTDTTVSAHVSGLVTLQHSTSLQSLILLDIDAKNLQLVGDMLKTSTSQVEEIWIEVVLLTPPDGSSPEWKVLDETLMGKQFKSLQAVFLTWMYNDTEPDGFSYVRKSLPKLDAAGVLIVVGCSADPETRPPEQSAFFFSD